MLKQYGLTVEAYEKLAQDQHHKCAICNQPETATYASRPRRLAVDHNHTTSQLRALLCYRCNSLLGYGQESPAILRAAADYLEKHA